MARQIGYRRLICNYGPRTFAHRTDAEAVLVPAAVGELIEQHEPSILLEITK